jgi:hypothetical protein
MEGNKDKDGKWIPGQEPKSEDEAKKLANKQAYKVALTLVISDHNLNEK